MPFAFNMVKLAARMPFLVTFMRNRFEKNIDQALRRSISHEDILARMKSDEKMMGFYKELSYSTFDRMALRLPGTFNDIRVTQSTEYPLEDISVPTLVIHGTQDPIVPYEEHGKKLAQRIPDAKLCLLERGEHMAIFTHNEQVKESIAQFVTEIQGSL